MKTSLSMLAESLYKYSEYLRQKNQEMQVNHMNSMPVRSSSEEASFVFIKKSSWVKPDLSTRYASLQSQLDGEDSFVPVCVNDFAPVNAR